MVDAILVKDGGIVVKDGGIVVMDDADPGACSCCGATCCGPVGGCCFSTDSTVDFSITYSGGSGSICPTGATKSRTGIPYSAVDSNCSTGVVWKEVVGTETWQVTRNSGGWILYWEDSATGCFITFALNDVDGEVNCCGSNETITADYINYGFSSIDDTVSSELPASASLTVNGNTCCNDGGTCITGEDANCEGTCDSADPCTDCTDAAAGGADSESATVTGITDVGGGYCLAKFNKTYTFDGHENYGVYTYKATGAFGLYNDDLCEWSWNGGSGALVVLWYVHTNTTIDLDFGAGSPCSNIVATAGQWYIRLINLVASSFVVDDWVEETFGFACDPVTGKVSGSHTAVTQCGVASDCGGNPTIVVLP